LGIFGKGALAWLAMIVLNIAGAVIVVSLCKKI
jgi:hypothetical protein